MTTLAFKQGLDLAALKKRFDEDGFVLVKGFADKKATELLIRHGTEAKAALMGEASAASVSDGKKPAGARFAFKGLHRLSPWLAEQTFHGSHLPLLEYLLGDEVQPASTAFVDRPPGSQEGINPHIDGAGRPWHKRSGITLWIALDSMDEENGCLHYVRGSHRVRQVQGLAIAGYDERTPGVLPMAVAPGDAIIHHALTIHWSRGNSTHRSRRAITFFCFGVSAKAADARAHRP